MTFEERYARLNARQKEAVDTIDGPVMVIAGPGTGKTTILALRIANILKRTDTPASGILAITYTEAGVRAMREKLRGIVGGRADEVRIHTFHGFAARIIAEHDEHFVHIAGFEQITDTESAELIRDILRDSKFSMLRPGGDPDFYIRSIRGTISDAKGEAWTPEMLRTFACEEIERVKNDEASISTRGASKGSLKADALKRIEKCEKTIVLADVYEAYEARKREEEKLDFDDLLIELITALKGDELLLRLLQESFLYILVDEHQDTNDAQNLIVRLIADFFDMPNVFIVGDEKQAIYRFQGASVENFLKFQTAWPGMKVISLADNYRSHQNILDAGFGMIENNYGEGEHMALRSKLLASADEAKEVRKPLDVVEAGNTEAAEGYLADAVKAIVAKESSATVAVIVRRNRDVERALAALEARGVPAAAERGTDVFSHPAGRLFFELAKFLADPSAVEAFAHTAAAGLWGLSFEARTKVIREVRAGFPSLPALSDLMHDKSKGGVMAYLIKAAEVSGFTALIAADPLSVEVWRAILALAAEQVLRTGIDDPQKALEALVAAEASADFQNVKIPVGSPDAKVRVMTAHASKGLEFDHVFMPYAVEESWMTRARGSYFVLPREKDQGDDVRDARRLFYVALTRARKHVCIVSSLQEALGRELSPVRFIAELPEGLIARTELPSKGADISLKREDALSKQERELADYAKNILLDRGLSVTALNHFLECPSQFLYKSILRLPEPPTPSSEKGTAMHEAISEAWKLDGVDEQSIAVSLEETIRSYFAKQSLLPLFEKESVLAELVNDMPAVARALAIHMSIGKGAGVSVSTEGWLETSYQSPATTIRLHGKIDTLIDAPETVHIFDYKTRQALSENAARERGYFRQLVFYRILASADRRFKDKKIVPALMFVSPDAKDRCPTMELSIAKADEDAVRAEVAALIESVWSGEVVRARCDEPKCQWCGLKSLLC